MDAGRWQAVGLGLGAQQVPQELGKRPLGQDGDVLAGHLERTNADGGHRVRLAPSQRGKCGGIGLKKPQQVDHRGGGPHGPGLVLREGAWITAQQLAGLDLRETETFPNDADFFRSDFDLLSSGGDTER